MYELIADNQTFRPEKENEQKYKNYKTSIIHGLLRNINKSMKKKKKIFFSTNSKWVAIL